MLNPEELINAGKAVKAAAQAAEDAGRAASKLPEADEAVKNVSAAVGKDAKSGTSFFSKIFGAGKKTASTAGVAGLGAKAESMLGDKSSDAVNDSTSASNNASGPSSGATPNPGAFSPAGRIDLPGISSAEDIAGGVDPSSFADTRGLKGGSGTSGGDSENISNRKLNKIISLLESMLSVERSSMRAMGAGFRNLTQVQVQGFNMMAGRQQASEMENTSSGRGGGGFLNSIMSHPVQTAMGTLKGMGIAALGAFGAGAAIDIIKNQATSSATSSSGAATLQQSIETAKKEYGAKDYVVKMMGQIFKMHQDEFRKIQQKYKDKDDRVIQEFGILKDLYDKLDDSGKKQFVGVLANINNVSPGHAQDIIDHQNSWLTSHARAAGTGAVHGLASFAGSLQSIAVKGVGYAGEGLMKGSGWIAGAEGHYGSEKYLDKKGEAFSKGANKFADDNYSTWESNGKAADSPINIADSLTHPNYFKGGYAGAEAAAGALTGGATGAVAGGITLAASAAGGAMAHVPGQSVDVFSDSSGLSSKVTKGRKLKPQEQMRAKKALAFFQSKGWSKDQAAAIVGNLLQESNLDPDIVNPKSGARGIAQWIGSRVDDFENQEKVPLKGSSFENQLDFVNWELNHSEKKAGDAIRSTTGIQNATEAVATKYERMGANESMMDRRIGYAQAVAGNFDPDSLKPKPQVASTATQPSPTVVQGGTNISRNTTINSASAAAPGYLQDNVTPS